MLLVIEDPEYFQQLLLSAKNQNDPYTAWESRLDFDEFVAGFVWRAAAMITTSLSQLLKALKHKAISDGF